MILLLAAVAAVVALSSCNMVAGSGVIVDTEYEFDGFKSIEAGNACNITITQSSEYSVKVSCDDNVVNLLDVKMEGDNVHFYLAPFTSYNRVTYKVEITAPDVEIIKGADASKLVVSGFSRNDTLDIALSDASSADISMITATDVNAVISDASKCVFSADSMIGNLGLTCSDASTADFRNAEAADVDVRVSDASEAWVNLRGSLSGTVSDASSLHYTGTTNISGLSVHFPSDLIHY